MAQVDFYHTYKQFKDYHTPELKKRNIKQFDRVIWRPMNCESNMSYLEVGCGLGHFLLYLKSKQVKNFLGIDLDANLADYLPTEVRENFRAVKIEKFVKAKQKFDRIIMLDVLEHFDPSSGTSLLIEIKKILNAGGKLLVRVPNAGSPWGIQNQFGDLTHKTCFAPGSLKQIATAAGFKVTSLYPHKEGSTGKRFTENCIHWLLSRLITHPPEIWAANICAILEKRED